MNIGLVLSGGMAKGAFQIGALRAINDFIPFDEIKYISCASVGVLNGYAYAARRLSVAEDMWRNVCTGGRLIVNQVLRSALLQENIRNLYAEDAELPEALYCALLDATHRNIVYKNLSSADRAHVPLYLKASVAMPVYNRSVPIGGVSYFDGAMIDNIPVFPLLKHCLDYLICLYFDNTCYRFENACFDDKIIKITFPSEGVLRQSLIFRQDGIEKMIRDGFERATDILSAVFHKGYEDLEYIRQTVARRNRSEKHSLRITGDVLTTNLNRVARRFVKRKIEY